METRVGSLDHRCNYDRILSKYPTLIHPLGSFITANSRERNGKGVSGETVDGVKERDDESGQPETMSYRRQAFAARLSRLVSFSVPSFLPSTSYNSLLFIPP